MEIITVIILAVIIQLQIKGNSQGVKYPDNSIDNPYKS
jgi:hypothetical protein